MQNGELKFTFLDLMEEFFVAGEKFNEKRNDKFLKLAERFSMTEWLHQKDEETVY